MSTDVLPEKSLIVTVVSLLSGVVKSFYKPYEVTE